MKTIYKEKEENKLLEFATDWQDLFGIDLLSKKFVPVDSPFWIVSDDELETLKDVSVEAWEVSGEPNGIGGLSPDEETQYNNGVNKMRAEADRVYREVLNGKNKPEETEVIE